MIRARLSVFYQDDIKTYYGQIFSYDPIVIKIPYFSAETVDQTIEIRLEWHDDDSLVKSIVEYVRQEGELITFKVLKQQKSEPREYHVVEYKGLLEIKTVTDREVAKYKLLSDKVNNSIKSSLAGKIKNIAGNEGTTNQLMFKMLLQIDSKLDEMLKIVRSDSDEPDLISVSSMYLSGGGFGFFGREKYEKGQYIYVKSDIGDLKFAAVASVSGSMKTDAGFLYSTEFVYISNYARESVIKFIFEKDRELLKGVNE